MLLLPVFAGKLVDAVATTGDRAVALNAAISALAAILGLGLIAIAVRHAAFIAIIRLTLRMMVDVAGGAFHRVQRFSTDWHDNSFAGSTVRKISRGMWALDTFNDTLLLALLPSLLVLVGSAVCSPSIGQ